MNPTDAADLVQEVMTSLVTLLPKFEYNPGKRFRGWLRTVTVNKARDLHRRKSADPLRNIQTQEIQVIPDEAPVSSSRKSNIAVF